MDKGSRVLRIEVVAHNATDSHFKRDFSTDSHFKHHFSPIGTLSLARRSVNLVKILSRPAVFSGLLRFAASDFPQSARRHERKPSRAIGSLAKTRPDLRIKPPEIVPRAAPASVVAVEPTELAPFDWTEFRV